MTLEHTQMTSKIKQVPAIRPKTDPPTEMHNADQEEELHKKMERDADRAAHKAADTQKKREEDQTEFSI